MVATVQNQHHSSRLASDQLDRYRTAPSPSSTWPRLTTSTYRKTRPNRRPRARLKRSSQRRAQTHGGDRACYVPSKDFTALPNPSTFRDEQNYRATKLHELCHWTGHEKRLNRNLKNRFGTRAYAAEELVAELGAAFLCAHLGVQGRTAPRGLHRQLAVDAQGGRPRDLHCGIKSERCGGLLALVL